MSYHEERGRYGSARFATQNEIAQAGLFRQTRTSLYALTAFEKRLWVDASLGSACVIGGSQGGKGAAFINQNNCHGVLPGTSQILLDFKGELACIGQDQTPDGKACIYFNPMGMHDMPQNRINPCAFLTKDSPTLVADAQTLAENLCPCTPNNNGDYFQLRAQHRIAGIIVGLLNQNGVLTLPDLYDAINAIPAGKEDWLDVAWSMHSSGLDISHRVEEEIAAARENPGDGSGSNGILGEMLKAVAPLADPQLRKALSPPFDYTLDQLCDPNQPTQLYLMCPPENAQLWAPVIKSFFVGAMIEKTRRPEAPRQVWLIDEAGQLGGFPLLIKLHTFAAGIGITTISIFQSSRQIDNLGPNGRAIVLSSAALQINFAIRDIEEARRISDMLGVQTLDFDRHLHQGEAAMHRREAVQRMMRGGDPFELNARLSHLRHAKVHKSQDRRPLRTPDEVLNGPEGEAFIFVDGLRYPILAQRRRYFEDRLFAYRYHPNPFYPPTGKVQVMTRFGRRWRPVIREPVPARYAHLPQYADGFWSRIGR